MRKYIPVLILISSLLLSTTTRAGDRCALIAGGSRGIGYAIAEALAKRGWDLVLIARGMPDLELAKARLEAAYGVQVHVISKDLSLESAPEEIAEWCREKTIPLRMVCNVAGFGGARDFLQLPADTLRYMLRLNLESSVMLTYALLPLLEQRAPSYILNVASMAGLAPMPAKNIYSATKSAIIFFSYSLKYQLRDKGISVSCLAPGPVYTKQEVVNTTHKMLGKRLGDWIEVPPAKVGEITVRRMLKGRLLIVPGTVANVASKLIRIVPRKWAAAIFASGMN